MSQKSSTDAGTFPVAGPVTTEQVATELDGLAPLSGAADLHAAFPVPSRAPIPRPPLHFCALSLPQGCYQLNITTNSLPPRFLLRSFKLGTLRIEQTAAGFTISGDTYRYSFFDLLQGTIPSFGPTEIPIYPRSRYGSYLQATGVTIPRISFGPCRITLNLDEYDYTQPTAGTFDGHFPAAPSRSMTVYLTPATPPSGFTGAYFTGEVYVGGVLQPGVTLTLAWVSARYRKATVELHTMTGSVAPAAVGAEYFTTVYDNANWDLTVKTDPTAIPSPTQAPPYPAGWVQPTYPAGWTATSNWGGNVQALHDLMTHLLDYSSVDLDKTWYMHVLIVPAAMGDGRGIMFDSINVPREGVASFSDDGYPSAQSANFGTAANKEQRDVPRAFLRSASHEITHGFNQIHQENEGGADNSIMTTTPSVADFLHAHGQTFPGDIFLGFNDHVRHHLRHLPDIVIRPGGMTFTAGHNGIPVPQADLDGDEIFVDHPALDLELAAKQRRVKIGEPLRLDWELKNASDQSVWLPGDLSIENEFAEISVTKPSGDELQMPAYAIKCDSAYFVDGKPGHKLSARHHLFWSPQGFAFETPGKHTVNLEISWRSGGATVGKRASVDVFVDYPVTDEENEVIAHVMNDEVGKYVALGGHAYHLTRAVDHIEAVMKLAADHPATKAIAAFYDAKRAAAHRDVKPGSKKKHQP